MLEKIKNFYYDDNLKEGFATGLFFETESGKIYRHQTDTPIMPFQRVKELPKKLKNMKRKYKMFLDESYYHLWCVREVSDRDFNHTWHFVKKEDAESLIKLLNKAE